MFNNLSKDISDFQDTTNLKCLAQCGLCCTKPDISATPLEFLPLAYHLFKQKKALEWREHLSEFKGSICPLFKSLVLEGDRGFCSDYKHRGLICRLFGFSASLDKTGKPTFITCRPIKETMPDEFNNAQRLINDGGLVPVMRNYYFQLSGIDANLNMRFYPIREAMLKALETVLAYYAYRRAV